MVAKAIAPLRRGWQWLAAAIFFALPYLEANGNSFCRIDLDRLTFYLGGKIFRVEELYLFGLAGSAGLFFFLFLTQILGRVWCGWGCPQTAFADLAEVVARRLRLRLSAGLPAGSGGRLLLFHLFLLLGGLGVGWGTVAYFVPPRELLARLLAGELAGWPLAAMVAMAGLVYLDLAFVRRLFCREFCPYGRFQTALVDPAALTLQLAPADAERCLDCQACLRACPMGIDIRAGMQVECINCGQCRDACFRVMAPRRQAGLIRYRFGEGARGGWRELLNVRVALVAGVAGVLLLGSMMAFNRRGELRLTVARSAVSAARLTAAGRMVTFFQGSVNNLGRNRQKLTIVAQLADGRALELRGTTNVELAGGEKCQLSLAVETELPSGARPLSLQLQVIDGQGRILVERPLQVVNPNP